MAVDCIRTAPIDPSTNTLQRKSNERHNSENNSGFGRDLRNWVGKETVLPGNTISVGLVGKNMGHPAVFPVGVPEFFIKLFSKEGDRVLDPFAGSGSTGVACEMNSRNAVLIENKAEYVDVIKQRLCRLRSASRERFYHSDLQAEAIPWQESQTLFDSEDDATATKPVEDTKPIEFKVRRTKQSRGTRAKPKVRRAKMQLT